jgi:hypothetical protein
MGFRDQPIELALVTKIDSLKKTVNADGSIHRLTRTVEITFGAL